MREKRDIRLFFALWPDEPVRQQISCYLESLSPYSGLVVPSFNWHMTLHFVGNTTFEEKICLDRQANKVQIKPFEITIDKTGYFKKPKVFWLGCRRPPQALFDLQEKLGWQIGHCEYQPESRPYSPHITVMRKVMKKPDFESVGRINWQVDRFVMIESVAQSGGVRYQVVEEYLCA